MLTLFLYLFFLKAEGNYDFSIERLIDSNKKFKIYLEFSKNLKNASQFNLGISPQINLFKKLHIITSMNLLFAKNKIQPNFALGGLVDLNHILSLKFFINICMLDSKANYKVSGNFAIVFNLNSKTRISGNFSQHSQTFPKYETHKEVTKNATDNLEDNLEKIEEVFTKKEVPILAQLKAQEENFRIGLIEKEEQENWDKLTENGHEISLSESVGDKINEFQKKFASILDLTNNENEEGGE